MQRCAWHANMMAAILPSIESFQMRLLLPKVYYIFYEYFFKAVIGEGTWKRCFTGNKRFGTNILEAYAHAIIKNNYFAWLYDYKSKHPASTLQTEYDLAVQKSYKSDDDDEEQEDDDDAEEPTFCGDLDKVEIALRRDRGTGFEYHLVTDAPTTKAEYKEAQEDARRARNLVLANLTDENRDSYERVNALLTSDTSDTSDTSSPMDSHSLAKELTKKKAQVHA